MVVTPRGVSESVRSNARPPARERLDKGLHRTRRNPMADGIDGAREPLATSSQPGSETRRPVGRRKRGRRDGLFQRNGWWWIDYYDAEGKRHRKKAAPDYQTAKLRYRNTMTAIA